MQLGSSESIKTYLANSDTAALISIHTIQKELKAGELFIIDFQNLAIIRQFSYVQRQGSQSGLVEGFLQFLKHYFPKNLFENQFKYAPDWKKTVFYLQWFRLHSLFLWESYCGIISKLTKR